MNPIKLYEENKVIAGFSLLNLLFKHRKCSLVKSVMDKLLSLYDQKKIKPVVDSLWALEEVRRSTMVILKVNSSQWFYEKREDFMLTSWTVYKLLFVTAAFCGTLSAARRHFSTDGG